MGPHTPEGYGTARHGTARRGATSFPLASTGAKQREGGREGGRGRWRLLTAEPGRSPPAAAESRTRVADPGVSETKRGMPGCGGGLGLSRTPPAPRRGAQRSPPRCRSRPGSRRGAERREEPARRRAARQGRCLHAQRPGRRRAPVVAVTARSSARQPPPAPGTWSRIPSELRPVGQGRAGQAPFQYFHVCPNIVVGAHGSSGRI